MSSTVTRRSLGRSQDKDPLVKSTHNHPRDPFALSLNRNGGGSPSFRINKRLKSSTSNKSSRHGYVSFRLRLGMFGCAFILWFFFDPIVNNTSRQQMALPLPTGWTVKKEVVYPRGLYYDLGEPEDDAEENSRAIKPIISSARHYRYSKVERISEAHDQRRIRSSKEYKSLNEYENQDKMDCQLEHEWQRTYRPICNSMHEVDLSSPIIETDGSSKFRYLTHGYYRDVWALRDDTDRKTVFKPMRYKHAYTYRNFDRMRRDALTMDRLTGEKYILNIYANCGTSGLFEYADGGDIESALWEDERGGETADLPQLEKLHIATQAAMGLASVHNIDAEGRASVAHTDIAPGQFIKVNGIYKLNDFNRARFLKYSQANHTACPFYVGNNAGKNRSPEEYDYGPETEMVDVYSFGNILYMLLQGDWPFDDKSDEDAQDLVLKGVRPTIYEDIWNSTDPVNKVLKKAMIMCHAQEPEDRASARAVETFLKNSMRKLDPGRLEEWGDA